MQQREGKFFPENEYAHTHTHTQTNYTVLERKFEPLSAHAVRSFVIFSGQIIQSKGEHAGSHIPPLPQICPLLHNFYFF